MKKLLILNLICLILLTGCDIGTRSVKQQRFAIQEYEDVDNQLGYATILEDKIVVGDETKFLYELTFLERVGLIANLGNKCIIKHNGLLGVIDTKRLRFPKGERPYVYPKFDEEPVYELSLSLYKGESYEILDQTETEFLVLYPLKNINLQIWINKQFCEAKI